MSNVTAPIGLVSLEILDPWEEVHFRAEREEQLEGLTTRMDREHVDALIVERRKHTRTASSNSHVPLLHLMTNGLVKA